MFVFVCTEMFGLSIGPSVLLTCSVQASNRHPIHLGRQNSTVINAHILFDLALEVAPHRNSALQLRETRSQDKCLSRDGDKYQHSQH